MTKKLDYSKLGALASVLQGIEKAEGEAIFIDTLPNREIIPFSSASLNFATWGGIRYGVSTEIVGEESSGKSTLALDLIHNFQKIEEFRYKRLLKEAQADLKKAKTAAQVSKAQDALDNVIERRCVYLDLERTTDPRWMSKNRVDASKVIIYAPAPSGIEGPLDNIVEMMATGIVGMVVIDSVGAMISTAEDESDIGKGNFGGASKPLTKYYKKAMPLVAVHSVAHVVINQTREDMSGYNQLVRPGGKMHKFAQALVLRLAPSAQYLENYQPATRKDGLVSAKSSVFSVIKHKAASAGRQTGIFTIKMDHGIDKEFDLAEHMIALGEIRVAGSFYTLTLPETGEEIKVQGKAKLVTYLRENPDIYQKLWDKSYEMSLADYEEEEGE